jgi:hypothetical protein
VITVRKSSSRNGEPYAQGRLNSTAARASRRPYHADTKAQRGFIDALFVALFCGSIDLAASLIEIVFQLVWQGCIIFFLFFLPMMLLLWLFE